LSDTTGAALRAPCGLASRGPDQGQPCRTSKRSTYRGFSITTRWTDLRLADRRPGLGFDAAFAVCPTDPNGESWQKFPKTIFPTSDAAEANALGEARRSIDELVDAPPAEQIRARGWKQAHIRPGVTAGPRTRV